MNCQKPVTLILAGGRGNRLKSLTKNTPKPVVYFGGGYRLIDFCLSNCYHSGIDIIGVLTQYEPLKLHKYIGNGRPWHLDRDNRGIYLLTPYVDFEGNKRWYQATANAVYQNIKFVENFNPEEILILSADHVYKMDYNQMREFHKNKNAEVTISVVKVPREVTHNFGILDVNKDNSIKKFTEKPKNATSNLASMGIYIFNWKLLKKYLNEDNLKEGSSHDFGRDIIPQMLFDDVKLFAYPFQGYWRDVGTINSLWEANMDLLSEDSELKLNDNNWKIYSRENSKLPYSQISGAVIENSLIGAGASVYGDLINTVIGQESYIGADSQIIDSVIMPEVKIEKNVKISKAIVGKGAVVNKGVTISGNKERDIFLVGEDEVVC